MNSDQSAILAKKYAQAFMNVYGDQLDHDQYRHIPPFTAFLYQNRTVLAFLSIPHIPDQNKIDLLASLLNQFLLSPFFVKLVELIIAHKRSRLLPIILEYMYELFQMKYHVVECALSSSHGLSDEEQACVAEYLSQQTGKTVLYTHRLDPTLIAGIRAQAQTFVWEYSIKKKLNALTHAFMISH
jgi:F-type H+-transporting ATPase subunit delta